MRSRAVIAIAFICLLVAAATAQEIVKASEAPSPAQPAAVAPVTATGSAPASAAAKADALLLYRQGRDLEAAGKKPEAASRYRDSIVICDKELAGDPTRMDAYTVKCWSLFRLERYREVIDMGNAGLKIKFDARIVEPESVQKYCKSASEVL